MLKEYECFICQNTFKREEIDYHSVRGNIAIIKVEDMCCSNKCKKIVKDYDKKMKAIDKIVKLVGEDNTIIVERNNRMYCTVIVDMI